MAKKKPERPPRPIQTVYYQKGTVVKITRSKWANNAVPAAVKHMQLRNYDATVCEVYDAFTGELHAVLKMPIGRNKLEVLFKRDVKEGM